MFYLHHQTPAGKVLLLSDGKVLTGLLWSIYRHIPTIKADWIEDQTVFQSVITQLDEYFAGTRKSFDISYQLQGSAFQLAVWQEIEKIPYGAHQSYQTIAAAIGKPLAIRAVGTAVGSNPISIIVPCHRVLTSTNQLGGYAGGLNAKKYLLAREGIQ